MLATQWAPRACGHCGQQPGVEHAQQHSCLPVRLRNLCKYMHPVVRFPIHLRIANVHSACAGSDQFDCNASDAYYNSPECTQLIIPLKYPDTRPANGHVQVNTVVPLNASFSQKHSRQVKIHQQQVLKLAVVFKIAARSHHHHCDTTKQTSL